MNIDHGVLPGGTDIIMPSLGLSTSEYANLESGVFFGNILGSLIATVVYRELPTKYVLLGVLALNAAM